MAPQEHVSVSNEIMEPLGFDSELVLTTAKPLPAPIPSGAVSALVQAETAGVRWRDDGGTPVAGAGGGMLIAVNQVVLFTGNLDDLLFIQEAAGATINVSYSKY